MMVLSADTSPLSPAATQITGAAMLLETLAEMGVDTIFGYPGGAVLPLYDALFCQDRIRHILVRHEQAAVHAAEGYARSTGKLGVVVVTSGPGATNTLTGLADAMMDSVPILCITGQVTSALIGTDGFQEANIISMSRAVTKYNCTIRRISHLVATVRRAAHIASDGRPGPVLIDVPKDLQAHTTDRAGFNEPLQNIAPAAVAQPPGAATADIVRAAEMLRSSQRPVLYTGGGVINSGPHAIAQLRTLAERSNAPVTSTLLGLGAYPASGPQWLGMPGMHGTYEANLAMHGCDVMLCVGARFDDRVTGRLAGFAPLARKIHIDIDASQIDKVVPAEIGLVGDCNKVLMSLLAALGSAPFAPLADWWQKIDAWRARDCLAYQQDDGAILPQHAIARLQAITRQLSPIISTEVGQHQMWAAQHMAFDRPNKWLTSGGLGTMGYGLPAAIGAQIANPGALVIDIAGEASIQMNIQELATAMQYDLPVKVFIINNERMGMVRQWQDRHHEGRRACSYASALPDFVALAQAYGWTGLRVSAPAELDETIERMIATPGPVLVDCRVAPDENCLPMMPTGAVHNELVLC